MKEHELREIKQRPRHACLLYRDQNDQKRYLLPFLQEGLLQGEHCLFICPEACVDDWSLEFQAFGIDVLACRQDGALVIVTGEQWRRTPFASLSKAREVWAHIEATLADFPAIRIAGEASWTSIEPPIASDRLCHWEATADVLYEDEPVQCVCMYDLGASAPSDIRAALRTHPYVVLERRTYLNPFYETDAILEHDPELNDSEADASTIEAMLARILHTEPSTPD